MEVRISGIDIMDELSTSLLSERYRVMSSSLEVLADRLVLQVELTERPVNYAGKDDKAPVDYSGRPPLCQCGICRINREGAQGTVAFQG